MTTKIKWSKAVEFSRDCISGLPCPDLAEDQFKEIIEKNQKGVDEGQLKQAFFFRRMDIFTDLNTLVGSESLMPNTSYGNHQMVQTGDLSNDGEAFQNADVIDFFNYRKNENLGHLSVFEHISNPDPTRVIGRKRFYSRSGWPTSSKDSWKLMSNNFRISKVIKKEEFDNTTSVGKKFTSKKSSIAFPKSVSEFGMGTIISFTGIDISFEGTYQETARSDVQVKIRATLNNFDLLENYYDSDGEYIDSTSVDLDKHLRFLDLFTPAELDEDNQGIMLEVYTTHANENGDDLETHRKPQTDAKYLSYHNYLKLDLYIVDHTLSFDEVNNKVNIEIEYRAGADMGVVNNRVGPKNILYGDVEREKFRKILINSQFLLEKRCTEKSSEEIDKIADLRKKEFKEHIDLRIPMVNLNFEDPLKPYIKNYNLSVGGASGISKLDYNSFAYTTGFDDDVIFMGLHEANVSSEMKTYHFVTLRNLLADLIPQDLLDHYKVMLPFVPMKVRGFGVDSFGFYLGDLPIAVELFEDWFNKKYIIENVSYLDVKTLVKDIIMNYVNPCLRLSSWDNNQKVELATSSFNMFGEFTYDNSTADPPTMNSPRVNEKLWGNASERGAVKFVPKIPTNDAAKVVSQGDFEDKHGKDYVFINVYVVESEDFLAGKLQGANSIKDKLDIISNYRTVIEAKSPYGPFKSLKLSANNTDYLREVRLEQQGKTDISQLGNVYDATVTTYPNCPDFRFFPGDYVYLYVPDLGFASDTDNLAYKLGIGGHQIITNVVHKIELEGSAKMSTEVTMRYWNSGVKNQHQNNPSASGCVVRSSPGDPGYSPVSIERDTSDEYVDPNDSGWGEPK